LALPAESGCCVAAAAVVAGAGCAVAAAVVLGASLAVTGAPVAAAIWAVVSAQHRTLDLPLARSRHLLVDFLCLVLPGAATTPDAGRPAISVHSVDDHTSSRSRLHPVPRAWSLRSSSAVQTRPPLAAHTDTALLWATSRWHRPFSVDAPHTSADVPNVLPHPSSEHVLGDDAGLLLACLVLAAVLLGFAVVCLCAGLAVGFFCVAIAVISSAQHRRLGIFELRSMHTSGSLASELPATAQAPAAPDDVTHSASSAHVYVMSKSVWHPAAVPRTSSAFSSLAVQRRTP